MSLGPIGLEVPAATENRASEKSLFFVAAAVTASLGEDRILFPFPLDSGVLFLPPFLEGGVLSPHQIQRHGARCLPGGRDTRSPRALYLHRLGGRLRGQRLAEGLETGLNQPFRLALARSALRF